MRTTLTLDDDVAALLIGMRKRRGLSLKAVVNEALRKGLTRLEAEVRRTDRFETLSVDLGTCRLGCLDNVAEVLSLAEGDAHP